MVQRKIDTAFAYAAGLSATRKAHKRVPAPSARDEDFVSADVQRANSFGPDYDPAYFAKLDALIEEHYGPIVDYKIVNN